MRRCVATAVVLLCVGIVSQGVVAEDPPTSGATVAQKTSGQPGPATAEFQKTFAQWKDVLRELSTTQAKYRTATADARAELRKHWDESIAKAEAMQTVLIEAAEKAFVEAPNADGQLTEFLLEMTARDLRNDNDEEAMRRAELLRENKCENKYLDQLQGVAAFTLGDFDAAEKYLTAARNAKVPLAVGVPLPSGKGGDRDALDNLVKDFLKDPGRYQEAAATEKALRAAEAQADDLPRVLLRTSKGEIEIELFENEAPNTVANFISLVEKKFYDGLVLHRVLPGFVAQGGDPKGDGTGGPGYAIACECYQPNYRHHFRGSLSMAHAGRDSGGSQFFLSFLPASHLDGKHTVFGRVIKGFDVLGKLQRRDPDDADNADLPKPDKIIEAKVLRKRDHKYEPTTLPGK
jgi:cyclophilin family peptidyl-prolyl cis-trans isomerase